MQNIFRNCCAFLFCISCTKASHTTAQVFADSTVVVYAPVQLQKKVKTKVFVHLMPWFETKETNTPEGTWGQHWTMSNQNPDIINANGQRQIASYYYPLTGPYASGDSNVIEYQLLLMKLSGIDGVFIDWPGTVNLYDYAENLKSAEKVIAALGAVGLNYAIVYEDQNVNIAYNNGTISDKIAAAQNDMKYMQTNYFNNSNYEKLNGKPLLLDFGPQTFSTQANWQNIFSVLSPQPSFFTLWGQSGQAGSAATGEFAWINSDNITSLNNFYGNSYTGLKIGSAYPGFNTFYAQGALSGPTWIINANGTNNFQTTLTLALQSNVNYIQLPTWNDYGEGTMIEPTVQFQYSLLTSLQQNLGVQFSKSDLELVNQLYNLRIKYAGNLMVQKKLKQVFYYIVSLQLSKAYTLLNSIT